MQHLTQITAEEDNSICFLGRAASMRSRIINLPLFLCTDWTEIDILCCSEMRFLCFLGLEWRGAVWHGMYTYVAAHQFVLLKFPHCKPQIMPEGLYLEPSTIFMLATAFGKCIYEKLKKTTRKKCTDAHFFCHSANLKFSLNQTI